MVSMELTVAPHLRRSLPPKGRMEATALIAAPTATGSEAMVVRVEPEAPRPQSEAATAGTVEVHTSLRREHTWAREARPAREATEAARRAEQEARAETVGGVNPVVPQAWAARLERQLGGLVAHKALLGMGARTVHRTSTVPPGPKALEVLEAPERWADYAPHPPPPSSEEPHLANC
jgi:hypothetical protein